MSVTVRELYNFVNSFAPFDVKWSRDNVGILVGDARHECGRALLALDITAGTVQEAKDKSADVIISHHPVIFNPISNLCDGSPAYLLAKYGICALCCHTNLDYAPGGVNDVLIRICGVEGDISELYDEEGHACGRIGRICKPMDARAYAEKLKHSLNSPAARFSDPVSNVDKIAVIGGAGAEYMPRAVAAGCDTLVTGEAKYHDFADAVHMGINLIELGHFATENPVIAELARRMADKFEDVEFIVSGQNDPVNII